MTATDMTTERKTDKLGFPVETCGRCGGTGHYSFNLMDGTRCFGCRGRGVRYTKRAAPHAAAYHSAVSESKWMPHPTLPNCQVPNRNPVKVDPAPYVERATAPAKRAKAAR